MVDVYVQSVGDASRAAADGTTLDDIHAEYQQLHRRAVVDAAAVLSHEQAHAQSVPRGNVRGNILPSCAGGSFLSAEEEASAGSREEAKRDGAAAAPRGGARSAPIRTDGRPRSSEA